MSELVNIERAVGLASNYIFQIWQRAYLGTIPGFVEIKANINKRSEAAESITLGKQLNLPNSGRFEGYIFTTKEIALDFEEGKAPWDMKPMLLGGPNVRTSKSGSKFNTVPFRHGTPGGGTKNRHATNVMSAKIYKATAWLKPGMRLTGTNKMHPPGANKATGAPHQSGIYEGLSRVTKKYEKKEESKYMTFRRVSDNSDPGAWWHPGNPAYNVAEKVANYCRPTVEKMIHDAAVLDLVDLKQVSVGMQIVAR